MTTKKETVLEALARIQQELKAPKSQYNDFGKYNYRNLEDILEAVKPLLNGFVLTLSDEMINVGDHNYIQAHATLTGNGDVYGTTAWAREAEAQKGMNDAQITGSTSSYARKYAVNGLFILDDTKDDDFNNQGKGGKGEKTGKGNVKKPVEKDENDTRAIESDLGAATDQGKQEKVEPEGSQGSEKKAKWTPDIWFDGIKRLKTTKSIEKKVKEAIDSGVLKVIFEQFPVQRDMLSKKHEAVRKDGEKSLGVYLINQGWEIPKIKGEDEPPSEDIEKDVNEVFGQPQIDPVFQKAVTEKMDAMKIDMGGAGQYVNWETFDKFLDLNAGQVEKTREAFVAMVTKAAKAKPDVIDRMMDKYTRYIEKMVGV